MRRLVDLRTGEQAWILQVAMRRRFLAALGFVPGATVQVHQEIRGGPVLVKLGESLYALGREVAADIVVEPDLHHSKGAMPRQGGHRHRWRIRRRGQQE